MFPNLLGQKAYHNLTDNDMAAIIGVSRNAWQQKVKSGRFTPRECKLLCDFFKKSFYFWKSKNENRAKYAQQFLTKFAEKYGAEVALRAAEIVLKD